MERDYTNIFLEVIAARSPDFRLFEDDIKKIQSATGLREEQIQGWVDLIQYHFSLEKTLNFFLVKEDPDPSTVEMVFSRFYVACLHVDVEFIRKINCIKLEFMISNFNKKTEIGEFYMIFKNRHSIRNARVFFQQLGGSVVCIQAFNDYDGDQKSVNALARVISRSDSCDYEAVKGKCPSGLWEKAFSHGADLNHECKETEIEFYIRLNKAIERERDKFELQVASLRQELKLMNDVMNENERLKAENKSLKEKCILIKAIDKMARMNEKLEVRLQMEEERVSKRSKSLARVILLE